MSDGNLSGGSRPEESTVAFELDGKTVQAQPGETLWAVAERLGTHIPHLCHKAAPDYRPDGNCRACMVEIEGERVLAASCKRMPVAGMKVRTASERAVQARAMVIELLVADQPARATSHDRASHFWRLEREGAVTYPVDAPDRPGNEIIFRNGFPTASGRGKIVPARIRPPDEIPDKEYPMVLSTGRVLEHWHTGAMTRRAGVLDEIEPEAVAFLAPRELHRLNLQPGDRLRLETRRGAVELHVRADGDVPLGMIFLPFCYAEAAANLLTNPALDPAGKIPEFKFCAARVTPLREAVAAEES